MLVAATAICEDSVPLARPSLMTTPRALIYSTNWCPWCTRAKALLEKHGVSYQEIDAEAEWGARFRDEIERRTGGRTVPQIVLDGKPVGGYEDLAVLAMDGLLGPPKDAT